MKVTFAALVLVVTAIGLSSLSAWAQRPAAPGAAGAPGGRPAAPAAPPTVQDLKTKCSYGIGLNIGRNMKKQSIDIDADMLAKGIKDAMAGVKPMLSDEEIDTAMQAFEKEITARQAEIAKKQAVENKQAGAAFLAANKKQPGVKVLPSGLQYKVLKDGQGKSPKATDLVKTHYRGTLIDGTEFDSSIGGEPVQFPLNRVIAGWTEALQLMKEGSKWQLVIPSELAYKEQGSPPDIGPNATLIFEIELLAVEPTQVELPPRR